MCKHTASFGFKKVPYKEKHRLVKDVFSNVASVYDIMNDLMSLGIHRLWKSHLVELILKHQPHIILDVGGGTGDIILRLKKINPNIDSYILDINKEMLFKGLERSIDLGFLNKINWLIGDAEKLPFKDNSFHVYCTAFCFRNLTNIEKALTEAYRVLKKGGRFYCLEFSKVDYSFLEKLYKIWSFKVIPKIGKIIAKNKNAYQYLVESIENFYNARDFKILIEKAGFMSVQYRKLSYGVASIHIGTKI